MEELIKKANVLVEALPYIRAFAGKTSMSGSARSSYTAAGHRSTRCSSGWPSSPSSARASA